MTKDDISDVDGFGKRPVVLLPRRYKNDGRPLPTSKFGFKLNTTPLTNEFESIESPIAGKKINFTGTMSKDRKQMQAQARALGAIVVDSTSGATNIVVTGEDPSASKVSKAKNATIYTEAEYNALIGE